MSDSSHRIGELTVARDGGGVSDATRQRIEAWFAAHWPHRRILEASRFSSPGGGASSEMLVFDLSWEENGQAGSARYVLRMEPSDDPVAPRVAGGYATSVELEYRVQSAIARDGHCPIAPLVGLEISPDLLGKPFYVMGFVGGRVPPTQGPNVDSFLVHDLNPDQRLALVRSGLEAMAAVHSLDWKQAGLEALGPVGGVEPLVASYRALCERYLRGAEHPVLYRTLDWLREHAPKDAEIVLTWGDSRPGNMVFGEDGRAVAALDWELAALLPAGTDVALWLLADYMVHEVEGAARLPGYPTRDQQLAWYEQCAGGEVADLAYWEIFTAMKVAYVVLRVVRRMQDAGLMPKEMNTMITDNFAVRFLDENLGRSSPAFVCR